MASPRAPDRPKIDFLAKPATPVDMNRPVPQIPQIGGQFGVQTGVQGVNTPTVPQQVAQQAAPAPMQQSMQMSETPTQPTQQVDIKTTEIMNNTGLDPAEFEMVKTSKKINKDQLSKISQAKGISEEETISTMREKGYDIEGISTMKDILGGSIKSIAGLPEFAGWLAEPLIKRPLGFIGNQIRKMVGKEELSEDDIDKLYENNVKDLGVSGVDTESGAYKTTKTITDIAQLADVALAGIGALKNVRRGEVIKNIADLGTMKGEDVVTKRGVKEMWEAISPNVPANTKIENIRGKGIEGVKEIGASKKTTIIPNEKGKEMIDTAIKIQLPANGTPAEKLTIAESALGKEADNMRNAIKETGDFAFNPKIITSRIDKIEPPLGMEISERQANLIKQEAKNIVERLDKKKATGLLDGRQEFDKVMNNKIKGLYTDPAKEGLKEYVMQIRDVMNDYLIEHAPSAEIADSLKLQSNIFGIIDNLRTYPGDIGGTTVSRFFKKRPMLKKIIGTLTAGTLGGAIGGAVFGQ